MFRQNNDFILHIEYSKFTIYKVLLQVCAKICKIMNFVKMQYKFLCFTQFLLLCCKIDIQKLRLISAFLQMEAALPPQHLYFKVVRFGIVFVSAKYMLAPATLILLHFALNAKFKFRFILQQGASGAEEQVTS